MLAMKGYSLQMSKSGSRGGRRVLKDLSEKHSGSRRS